MTQMQAIVLKGFGGPEVLDLGDVAAASGRAGAGSHQSGGCGR